MVFHWSLRDTKSSKMSRTILSILADFNNAAVWRVSTRPLISKSSSHFISSLVTVPSASITTDILAPFIFHYFFSSLARSTYLFFFSLFFPFYPVVCQNDKVYYSAGSPSCFFFLIFFFYFWLPLGLLVRPRMDDSFVSQSPREVLLL